MSEEGSIATSARKRSSDLHVDEKSQTFRRRRLSLSNLVTAATASAATTTTTAAAEPANDDPPADRWMPSDPESHVGKSTAKDERESGSRVAGGSVSLSLDKPSTMHSTCTGGAGDSEISSTKQTEDKLTDGDTEKAQTFRKRRLSLTHRLASEDSVPVVTVSQVPGHAEGASDGPVLDVHSPADDELRTGTSGHGQQQQLKLSLSAMNRRLSEASTGSLASSSSWPHHHGPPNAARLPCTIMHASELLEHNGGPPPSPALHNDSVLYRAVRQSTASKSAPAAADEAPPTEYRNPSPPSYFELPPPVADLPDTPAAPTTKVFDSGAMVAPESCGDVRATPAPNAMIQPRWKKRHVLTSEDKLPFPKHVVGMYSCHGIEPIYDDDDDDDGEGHDDGAFDDAHYRGRAVDDNGHILDAAGWGFPPPPPLSTAVTAAMDGGVVQLQFTPVKTSPSLLESAESESKLVSCDSSTLDPLTTPVRPTDDHDEKQNEQMLTGARHPPRPIHSVRATAIAKINQDRGGVAYPYGNCPRTALFAVYDGHGQGGELVSQFALSEIQRRLVRHPDFPDPRSFVETFVKVDEALRNEPLIDPNFAGTTACVVLMKNDELIVGNLGDSRAVVARRTGSPRDVDGNHNHGFTAIPLTEDQNPDAPGELERITTAGGYVTASPSPGLSSRVWLDASCTQIGLAMSRSIGDHSVSRIGVIAEPVVTNYQVDAYDEFLIVASDGVWEFLESQDAVDVVARNLQSRDDASKACQALIEAAAQRWHEEEGDYRDDITAIVVRLQHVWKSPVATSPNPANAKADGDS